MPKCNREKIREKVQASWDKMDMKTGEIATCESTWDRDAYRVLRGPKCIHGYTWACQHGKHAR